VITRARQDGASAGVQGAPPCCEPQGLLAVVSPWVTPTLVILGWLVVHWTSAARARKQALRQEDLDAVRVLEARVCKLRDLAIEYYTGDTPQATASAVKGSHIRYEIQSLSAAIRMLRGRREVYDVDSEMKALRRAITGGQFDSAERAKVAHHDPQVQEVCLEADRLIEELWSEFRKAHPP
jgi:hypothetical protein